MTEKSESYEVEEELPPLDSFEWGEGSKVVLDEMKLGGDEKTMLVSCKVMRFTAEAKIKPADYEQARGYVEIEPRDLWIHIVVHDPGKKVNDGGNVEIFGQVYQYIARELDLQVFDTASRRLDLRTAIQDRKDERKGGVHIGQQPTRQQGEVL